MGEEDELVRGIKRLEDKLTLQLALYRLVNSERLEEEINKILSNPARKKIYELCDGKTSGSEIAKKVGTTQQNVSYHLSQLSRLGLLSSELRDGKKYFYRTMEL